MKPVGVGLLAALLLMLGGCTSTSPRFSTPGQPRTSISPVPSVGERLKHAEGTTFTACPDVSKTLTVGAGANAAASAVAITFALADPEVAAQLSDPVAPVNGLVPHAAESKKGSIIGSSSARNDGLVVQACGDHVAARSWRVTIDDGTTSASLDTWLYLVRRQSGWKVWGSY